MLTIQCERLPSLSHQEVGQQSESDLAFGTSPLLLGKFIAMLLTTQGRRKLTPTGRRDLFGTHEKKLYELLIVFKL